MRKVALKLYNKSVGQIITFGGNVKEHIYGNPTIFAEPPIDQKTFGDHITDLLTAQEATIGGSPSDTQIRNSKLAIVIDDLNTMASYVDFISGGDILIIQAAGMEARKNGQRRTEDLEPPTNVEANSVFEGQMDLKWKSVVGSKNYAIEYTEDPINGPWIGGTLSTITKYSIIGLKSGGKYWFRVSAYGTNNKKSPWSNTVTKRAE